MKGLALAATCLLAIAPLGAASAQDYAARALNNPAEVNPYGAAGSRIDDPKVPGGNALRVTVTGKGANPWDAGLVSPVNQAVKAGDELVLAFWAKVVSAENGATSVTLPSNGLGLSSPPWTNLFNGAVTIGPEWKLYEVRGRADKDFAPGALNASVHLATGKQVIDIGPLYVAKAGGGAMAELAAAPDAPAKLAAIDPAKIPSMIINDPGNPAVNKARGRLIDDPKVTGGKALRVIVPKKGQNIWDSNVTSAIKKPIKKGDRLLLVVWARFEQGDSGATTATLPSNIVGLLSPPWTALLGGPADIGPEWKQFEYNGTATRDYAPGEAGISVQLAIARMTVDLGPIILLNLGQ